MKHHKLFFAIIFSFLMPFCATAQVQQGYVKTRGRLGSDGAVIPGEGIENVTVKVKNEGTVISDNSGCFEIALRNEKYYLENVTKKGYQLVDADILSKQYTRSVDTFKIVLTTPEQQLEDELASERKLRRTLTRQLHQREDEIEELYETNKIIKAERDSALRKLYADHADNEKLIKDMVERYSRIDYDQLDEFNRLISEYILNGELLKADSLLGSKGDILSRIEEYRTHKQLNDDERAELAEREKDLAKSEELERKRLADLAGDCYSKFEIFKLQHLNDSAAYYIELRASLDSTNVEWQLEAGDYIQEYLAYYDKAEQYYQCALQSALNKYGDKHPNVATSYNNIGLVYGNQGNYSQTLEYCNKALEILLAVFGEQHPDVATSYNNIGFVYSSQGNYSQALEYNNKALEIRLVVFGEQHPDVATSYINIGFVYDNQGNYSQALEYYNKALGILLAVFGEQHPDVATCYNNIGLVYGNQGNYSQALEYYNKALEILLAVFGEQHPDVATSYANIAAIMFRQGNYQGYLEYLEKSYNIRNDLLPSDHPQLLQTKKNIEFVKSKISE